MSKVLCVWWDINAMFRSVCIIYVYSFLVRVCTEVAIKLVLFITGLYVQHLKMLCSYFDRCSHSCCSYVLDIIKSQSISHLSCFLSLFFYNEVVHTSCVSCESEKTFVGCLKKFLQDPKLWVLISVFNRKYLRRDLSIF